MRGVKRRVSRKSGFFVLLALFAWLFLVLVVLPRRRHEAALAAGDADAGEHGLTRIEEPTTHGPEEAKPLADDADLADDVVQGHSGWHRTRPAPHLADPSAAPAMPTDPAADDPAGDVFEDQPNVRRALDQHDSVLRALREDAPTTSDRVPASGSPDVDDELLRRVLEALDAHASEAHSSLDVTRAPSQHAALPHAAGAPDPQPGLRMYLKAIWRFRWVIPVAVLAAILVPLLMLYRPLWPLGLDARATVSYVTKTQLLVDSPSGPFLRTETKSSVPPVTPTRAGSRNPAPTSSTQVFDTQSLVEAANLFPLLMDSDEVVALRRKLIGSVPGTVHATALFSTQGANRFRPSVLPVMQIIAVGPTPRSAVRLGRGTARAFELWLAREQNQAKVPRRERIVVRELRQPTTVQQTGGPAYGLPILAGLAVLGAFVGLAVALDRAFPRVRAGQPRLSSVKTALGPQELSKTAAVEPEESPQEVPYSDSLQRISETLREARAGSRPG